MGWGTGTEEDRRAAFERAREATRVRPWGWILDWPAGKWEAGEPTVTVLCMNRSGMHRTRATRRMRIRSKAPATVGWSRIPSGLSA